MPPKRSYEFTLNGIDPFRVEHKYLSMSRIEPDVAPKNVTKISDLEINKKTPDVIAFLDEFKTIRKCSVSMVDYRTKQSSTQKGLCCFWDRHPIPDGVRPLGCPVRYVGVRAVKTYDSHISRENYTITEPVTADRKKQIQENGDSKISFEGEEHYETDGIFCSFNCCMAFIKANGIRKIPLYRHSASLLMQMYTKLTGTPDIPEIIPAPHWRTLKAYGGHLTIEQYRDSFNKVEYIYRGPIMARTLGYMFEDRIKF